MTEQPGTSAPSSIGTATAVDTAIRIGLLGLLAYWSLKVVGPFLTVGLWSAIIAVALYPSFNWLAARLGNRRHLAAILVTLICLAIVIGPVTWLGFTLTTEVQQVVKDLDSQRLQIPLPADSVKSWPLIGVRVHHWWTLAAIDTRAILVQVAAMLKPLGGKLLAIAGAVGFGLLEFLAAIIIAGFLYAPGPHLAESLRAFVRRISGDRGDEMLRLAASTIRNVSRGVVGIALVQAFLAGIGFVVAGVPAAGFLTFVALLLGIVQIGPSILILPIVIWVWTAMDRTSALLFTIYMIPVSLLDNVFKPIVMAMGLSTPMPIIIVGVIGGTIAYGISGLFLGPIVLSVAWALVVAWVQDDGSKASTASS
jgi:predicted PurR-regulated permease PerM